MVDVNAADPDSAVAIVFVEESEVVVAVGEKLENGLGASSIG